MKRISKEQLGAVRNSNLFDEKYYLDQYPDVKALGIDPLEHYLWVGQKLGRKCSALDEKNDHNAINRNKIIICDGDGKNLPDLFRLRSKSFSAKRAIISYASDFAHLTKLKSIIDNIAGEHEFILAVQNKLAADARLFFDDLDCVLIAYPDRFGPAHALLHVANSGALSSYEKLCWIDATIGCDEMAGLAISRFWKQSTSKQNLVASTYENPPAEHSLFIESVMGTFLARLGRKKPARIPTCPAGAVCIIPALLLQQLRAYRIQPSELGAGGESKWLLSAIISIACDEAGLKKDTLSKECRTDFHSTSDRAVKAIAFYLPQFHPIAENDQWWGKGFTEWTNVANAKPVFRSHYQPNLPADLGFYDLRLPETQKSQADLAEKYSIHGFCYYYYWFNGRKLLNQPIEQMLRTGKPELPFCVCWANENWSRNWDGQNKHVLLEQSYSLESSRALIREFITMMNDARYIRHNGKPVLLVYRIRVIPNWLETAEMWREECRHAGIGEIHLCAVRFGLEPLDGPPAEFGMDSYVLFPPHESEKVDVKGEMHDIATDFNGTIFSYDAVVDGDVERFEDGYPWPVHRGAMLGWDNTARRPRDSRIFVGASPARFHYWLQEIVRQERKHNQDEESLIFINAWNEWAEGTTLEPNTRFGRGYLEAVRSAVGEMKCKPRFNSSELIPVGQIKYPLAETIWYNGEVERLTGAPTVLVCAHVVSDRLFGGERSFLDVLDALSELELNIIVAIPSDNHPHYLHMVKSRSMGVVAIPYKQWRDNREPDELIVRAFCEVIRERAVDVVYANTIVLLEPLVAARRECRQTVVHARELIDRDDALIEQIGIPSDEIVKVVSENADFLVANSRATAELFYREGTTFCAPNVVACENLDLENKISQYITFGIVSSNLPKKGIADFIEIARLCESLAPKARFIAIGPENSHVENWKTGHLPANMSFAGYAQDPRAAMATVNVVLSLSHFAESFGRTVAEAQAARRPVIAYDHGAVCELIEDGVTGFLVAHRDIDAAAAAVAQLCANPNLIKTMGEAGRSKMGKSHAPTTLKNNLWSAFQKILGSSISMRTNKVNRITVVVPVFNAHDEINACLNSLVRCVDFANTRVLIINDASTDHRVKSLLDRYASRDGFHVITNKANIGYTGTINIGIEWAGDDDVLLLNSDTIVTPSFLVGLRRTALSDAGIGTVTAMSDNAGAFSFPLANQPNPKPDDVTHDVHAAAILRRTADCEPVEVPTGSGFCMYVKRALFDAIGLFDEETFPRGYGEENDFCMRALNAGWRHLISPYAYVFHVRSASFGAEKDSLIKGAIDKVTRRYPDYASRVKSAFDSVEMQKLRNAAKTSFLVPSE